MKKINMTLTENEFIILSSALEDSVMWPNTYYTPSTMAPETKKKITQINRLRTKISKEYRKQNNF